MEKDGKPQERKTLQVKIRICARDLVPDELLYLDVVLRHKVDRVLLLADAAWAGRTLDCVRAFKNERSRFTREVGRESEDFLKFCGAERARHGRCGQSDGDGKLHKGDQMRLQVATRTPPVTNSACQRQTYND